MAEAALAFGSNLGDSRATIEASWKRLDAADAITLTKASSLYRTQPWGVRDQPEFVNACVLAQTSLAPTRLLSVCKAIETELGRVDGVRWGPRLIDIDILWVDGVTCDREGLTLPHPRMLDRAFVMLPLAEIAPDHVLDGQAVRDWAKSLDGSGVERIGSGEHSSDA